MSLVVKSWLLQTSPAKGEPYFRIVGRESGLLSFLLSLVGIDATTTMVVNKDQFEFERGSLSGFECAVTPHEHVCSAFYGQHKPWKTALVIMIASLVIGSSVMGGSTAKTVSGMLILLGGIAGGAIYYYLNRALLLGYNEASGASRSIIFSRTVVDGHEVNEEALRRLIVIIERLITKKDMDDLPTDFATGGTPSSTRLASAAPTSIKQVVTPAANKDKCPSCQNHVNPSEVFCGNCGAKL